MGSPEELLRPLKVVLSDLVGFAHERYCDAIKPSGAVVDQLRLVAAAEAFQTMSAVQQISQAVGNLERLMGEIDYWTSEVGRLTPVEATQPEPEPLKLPRSLLMASDDPSLTHGFWQGKGQYAIELGGRPDHMIELSPAGPNQVVAPKRAVILDVTGEGLLVEPEEWEEICKVVDWLLTTPPSTPVEEAKEAK